MPELEVQLRGLADDVVWPATPDIAGAVASAPRGRAPRRFSLHRRGARRVLVAVLAALLLVPAAAVAFPSARDDVLEWLGLRDVQIRRVPAPPAGARPELEADLGHRVTLAQAEREAGFAPALPAELGEPDRVRATGQRISLVYAARPGLPELDAVDAGLILAESRGGIPGEYLEKLLLGGTNVERVKIRGRRGVYISGGDHGYIYETPSGTVEEDRTLLAGPTVIWVAGGRVHRLETAAPRATALRIARSVEP
jgi:hypothetical protein